MYGGAGNDTFQVSSTNGRDDGFYGGSGTDTIQNTGGIFYFNNGTVVDSIEVIDGNGTRLQLDNNITIDLSSVQTTTNLTEIRASNSVDNIIATQDDDFIRG